MPFNKKVYTIYPKMEDHGDVFAVDLELFQMEQGRLHRPTGTFACLTVANDKFVWLYDNVEDAALALRSIHEARWVMHNAAFDLFHLRRWMDIPDRTPKQLWDTMIAERLMFAGFYDRFALDDLARRYLGKLLPKHHRKDFEERDSLTSTMVTYAKDDARATYDIYVAQQEALSGRFDQDAILRLWETVECPIIETVKDFKGILVDDAAWKKLADQHEAVKDKIRKEADYNPNSVQQVKAKFRKRYNFDIPNTQKTTMEDLAKKGYEEAEVVLQYREASKLAGTYGHKFLKKHKEEDSRIYSGYRTIGAETGRFSCRNPNMQNIPRAKGFRECFKPADGNVMIIADYSQQEARILAAMSNDTALIEAFESGDDVYAEIANQIYGRTDITKADPERFFGKTITLGLSYGLSPYGLADRASIEVSEAEELIKRFFRRFSGVSGYIDHYRWLAATNKYVQTRYGRTIWINEHTYQWKNNAINAPIQGGAADQMKLALIYLKDACRDAGIPYPVVAVVHDEIVAECSKDIADGVGALIKTAMERAGNELYPEVGWTVKPEIAESWAEKD